MSHNLHVRGTRPNKADVRADSADAHPRRDYPRTLSCLLGLVILTQSCVRVTASPNSPVPPITAQSDTAPAEGTAPLSEGELNELARLIVGNNTPEARALGARKLLESGADAAVERLTEALSASADPVAKRAVCQAVVDLFAPGNNGGRHPSPALLGPIANLLGDFPEMNELIVHALRRFRTDDVIPLLSKLASEKAASLAKREAAVTALGAMGDDLRAVAALVRLTENNSLLPEATILDALVDATGVRHAGAAAARAWWEDHKNMKPLPWLREVNERRIQETRLLRNQRESITNRLVAAYRELYLRAPEAQQPERLSEYLADPSPAIRSLAIELIDARITDRKEVAPQIREKLLGLLNDPESRIRRSAAILIGDLRPDGAVEPLIEALSRERQPDIRAAEAAALGRLDVDGAIPALVACLDDSDEIVVSEAVWALGTVARSERAAGGAVDGVVSVLLARFEQLPPDNDVLCVRFLEAMSRIGAPAFRPIYEKTLEQSLSPKQQAAAVAALSAFKDLQAVEAIRKHVGDEDAQVRLAVVSALQRCGQPLDDLALLEARMIAPEEPDPTVRERAWEAYQSLSAGAAGTLVLEAAEGWLNRADQLWTTRARSILQGLQQDRSRLAKLDGADRTRLIESLTTAFYELGEFDAALQLLSEALVEQPDNKDFRLRAAACALRLGRDDAALSDLAKAAAGDDADGVVRTMLLSQARMRLKNAETASRFESLFGLIASAGKAADQIFSPEAAVDVLNALDAIRSDAIKKRSALIERLIAELNQSRESSERLLAFNKRLVLPSLYEALAGESSSGAAVLTNEGKLIELAVYLAPDWPGYDPNDAHGRAAALDALKTLIEKESATRPASAPAASRPAQESPAP